MIPGTSARHGPRHEHQARGHGRAKRPGERRATARPRRPKICAPVRCGQDTRLTTRSRSARGRSSTRRPTAGATTLPRRSRAERRRAASPNDRRRGANQLMEEHERERERPPRAACRGHRAPAPGRPCRASGEGDDRSRTSTKSTKKARRAGDPAAISGAPSAGSAHAGSRFALAAPPAAGVSFPESSGGCASPRRTGASPEPS
jgi:hypothetical protein